jgi:hypothetical protein
MAEKAHAEPIRMPVAGNYQCYKVAVMGEETGRMSAYTIECQSEADAVAEAFRRFAAEGEALGQ